MFEDAGTLRDGDERLVGMNLAIAHDDQFARFDSADKFGADNIQRHGFRRKNE